MEKRPRLAREEADSTSPLRKKWRLAMNNRQPTDTQVAEEGCGMELASCYDAVADFGGDASTDDLLMHQSERMDQDQVNDDEDDEEDAPNAMAMSNQLLRDENELLRTQQSKLKAELTSLHHQHHKKHQQIQKLTSDLSCAFRLHKEKDKQVRVYQQEVETLKAQVSQLQKQLLQLGGAEPPALDNRAKAKAKASRLHAPSLQTPMINRKKPRKLEPTPGRHVTSKGEESDRPMATNTTSLTSAPPPPPPQRQQGADEQQVEIKQEPIQDQDHEDSKALLRQLAQSPLLCRKPASNCKEDPDASFTHGLKPETVQELQLFVDSLMQFQDNLAKRALKYQQSVRLLDAQRQKLTQHSVSEKMNEMVVRTELQHEQEELRKEREIVRVRQQELEFREEQLVQQQQELNQTQEQMVQQHEEQTLLEQREKQALENSLQERTQELECLRTGKQQLQDELKHHKELLQQTQSQLEETLRVKEEFVVQCNRWTEKHAKLQHEMSMLRNDLADKDQQLQETTSLYLQKQQSETTQQDAKQEALDQLQKQLDASEQARQDLKGELTQMEQRVANAKSELTDQLRKDFDAQLQQLKELHQQELAEAQRKSELDTNHQQQTNELKLRSEFASQLKAKEAELEEAKKLHQKELQHTQETLRLQHQEDLKAKVALMESERKLLIEQHDQDQKMQEAITKTLGLRLDEERGRHCKLVAELQSAVKDAQQQLQTLQKTSQEEKEDLRTQLDVKQRTTLAAARNEEQHKASEALQQVNAQHQASLKQLEQQRTERVDHLQSQLEAITKDKQQLEELNKKLQGQNQQLEQQEKDVQARLVLASVHTGATKSADGDDKTDEPLHALAAWRVEPKLRRFMQRYHQQAEAKCRALLVENAEYKRRLGLGVEDKENHQQLCLN